MLVDLGRNDLGRVCEFGSVRVPQYMALERYSHVMHLVSTVEGQLAEDRDHLDALVVVLPGGHGVRRAEDPRDADPRGARADAARSLCRRRRLHRLRRQPRFLHRDPHHHDPRRRGPRPGRRRHRRRLEPGGGVRRDARQGARAAAGDRRWRRPSCDELLLLLDNYDSFTFNLAQYLGELGHAPVVRRNDEITLGEIEAHAARSHRRSRRGPGRPEDAGITRRRHSPSSAQRVPVLGVCLGHQGIGHAFGGDGRPRARR